MDIEKIFTQSEKAPKGLCPLPEPGRGAPTIEEPSLLSIQKQPELFNYDKESNENENNAFRKRVLYHAISGKIPIPRAMKIISSL